MEPIVSVLMTAYNREKYIGEAIESVLSSTIENFELIIVDDRSKDRTVEIARSYEEKESRVSVYVNEKNLGDYPNRNKAASYARGKYIKYVDADDYIYPWGLKLLVEMMEKFPDAGWGLCSLIQNVEQPFPFLLSPKQAYHYHYKGTGLFHKAPLSSIIKKEVFDAVNGFSNIRMAGDFEMWNRLGQKYPVVLMPQGLVWYREHGEQEMNSYRKFLTVYEKLRLHYLKHPDCPLDKTEISEIIQHRKKTLRKQIIRSAITLNKDRLSDNFKCLEEYNG